MSSIKPKKQRKAIYKAPLHKKQKLVHAHLSKTLVKQYKKRSLGLRKGDEVKIVRGDFRGKAGKVTEIKLKKSKIYVEGVKKKKTTGEDANVPIAASNIIITNPNMDDPMRKKILQRVK